MILTRNYPTSKNLNNIFDELFSSLPATWSKDVRTENAPAVNIHENADGYHLELNAPGRIKEDFAINIEKGLLTISFEKKEEKADHEYKTIRREFSFGSFKRSFNLDEKINADAIQARYENGVLKLLLPKKDEVKVSPKQIQIQ